MSLFPFLRTNKQEAAADNGDFQSRAAEESQAIRNRSKRNANSAEDPVDPVLPEKKRARRRLIGAVALVLAAIIGLPMIFDSEPKPLSEDIEIQIPSKDKLVQSGIRRAAPAASASAVAASAALDHSEQIVEQPQTTEANKPAMVKNDAKPEAKAEQKPAKLEQKAVEIKVAEPKIAEVKPAPKSEPKATGKSGEEERARAILEDRLAAKPAAKASESKSGKYSVQVAALKTPEKINEVRGKLKSAGIETYTQKVATASGESTRIRVGPFASKEEADRMSAKLVKLGFSGKVVGP
ncbi:MAG: SPOR domain-containing protein [Burkholderiales bacterium]|nr:SPOR domain-containing protein [Burkholderiales bacterium]